MKPAPPPRIFGLLARRADVVAVFRRGPSRAVALLAWDLATDRVTLGQWLRGRIYERRADLSPDGQYLIYFAMDGRWQGPLGGSWTAVSRLPYLRALHLYGWGHCWNGGGLFLDNRRYWLNGTPASAETARCGLKATDDPPPGVVPMMGEDPVTYLPRLLRDGWTETGRGPAARGAYEFAFRRPVSAGWTLRKVFRMGVGTGPHGECYDDRHSLEGPGGETDLQAPWAETRAGEVLFARDGGLWRQRPGPGGPGTARLVADLTDLAFEARPAPYPGIRIPQRRAGP